MKINTDIIKDWKALILITLPLVATTLSDMMLSIVDTAFIGRLGSSELASVGIAVAIYTVIVQILGSLAIGYQILVARDFGSENINDVGNKLIHTFVLLFSTAIVGIIFLIFFSKLIVNLMTTNENVANDAMLYLFYRAPALIIVVGFILLKTTFDAKRLTKWGMYAFIIMNVSNILLNYILIFGIGPIPQLGVKGAALGTTIANLIGFAFFCVIFIKKKVAPFNNFKWNWGKFKGIYKLSMPEVINNSLDYIGNLVMVFILGLLGIYELAGGRVSFTILFVTFMLVFNFGLAIQILMSQSYGKNDISSFKRIFVNGRLFSTLIISFLGIFLILFPKSVLALFTPSANVIETTKGAIMIIGLTSPLMALTTSYVGALRALGKTKVVMYINLFSIWFVQIPSAFILGVYFQLGLTGVYLGFLFYFVSRTLCSHYFFKNYLKEVNENRKEMANETGKPIQS